MVAWWRTLGDGSRRSTSPREKFVRPMWKRFSVGIYLDAIARNPRLVVSIFVGVRCILFWISYVESDGFPIHQEERAVYGLLTDCFLSLINTWTEFRGYQW